MAVGKAAETEKVVNVGDGVVIKGTGGISGPVRNFGEDYVEIDIGEGRMLAATEDVVLFIDEEARAELARPISHFKQITFLSNFIDYSTLFKDTEHFKNVAEFRALFIKKPVETKDFFPKEYFPSQPED